MSARFVSSGLFRRAAVTAGLSGLGLAASNQASDYIARAYPDRPAPRDLLLDSIPHAAAAQYVADGLVLAAIALLLGYLLLKRRDDVPEVLSMFSVMYVLRAFMNVLTPLASPHGAGTYGWLPAQNGMFPSGHSANVLMCWLALDRSAPKGLRLTMLGIAVAEWLALLLSRGHYAIDIVGGVLLGYFVWSEWTRGTMFDWLKRFVSARSAL